MSLKINGVEIPAGNDGQYIEDLDFDENGEVIIVETEGGNYNERIEGDVVQGRVFICGGRQSGKSQEIRTQAEIFQQANPEASVRVVEPNPRPEPDIDPGSRRRHPVPPRAGRIIIMGGGNYNARIEGNYIQGDIVE